jgi:(4S)-4-hydroxy-5-phosphonooxypentane-2,3-dione isomerase
MHTVFVHVKVRAGKVSEFINATLDNTTNSRLEEGVIRFDFFQEVDDPTRFILVEVYRDEAEAGKHKETIHYNTWRSAVEEMMEQPRKGIRYQMINPEQR